MLSFCLRVRFPKALFEWHSTMPPAKKSHGSYLSARKGDVDCQFYESKQPENHFFDKETSKHLNLIILSKDPKRAKKQLNSQFWAPSVYDGLA